MQDDTVWNRIFRQEGPVFVTPHEDMEQFARFLKQRGAQRLLDLGCGSGRHTLYLAKQGFTVYGLDSAPEGIEMTRAQLKQAQLDAQLITHDIYQPLPFADGFFDAILSVKVLHHAYLERIRALFVELARILKPGGVLFLVVPMERKPELRYEEVEPGTFIPLDGREKGLPHHFFTIPEMQKLLKDFALTDSHEDSGGHYCFTAIKR